MSNVFDKSEISIPCAKCGHQTPKTIDWLKANKQFACSGCGVTIQLESEDLLRGIQDAEKAIAKFGREISKIGTGKI